MASDTAMLPDGTPWTCPSCGFKNDERHPLVCQGCGANVPFYTKSKPIANNSTSIQQ